MKRIALYMGLLVLLLLVGLAWAVLTRQGRLEEAVRERTAALSASQARYRQLFEASPDPLYVVDTQGRLLDVNAVAAARYGYSREELLSLTVHDLAAPAFREQVDARLKEALSTGARFEWRHRRKNGTELPVAINAQPVRLDGEQCILVSAYDLTERKRDEQRLAWLASFPQQNPIPVMEVNPQGEVTYANPAAERLFPDLRSQGSAHPMLAGLDAAASQLRRREQQSLAREVSFDGRTYEETVWCALDSEVICVYCLDSTQRRQAEAALRQERDLLSRIMETSPVGITVVDRRRAAGRRRAMPCSPMPR
jgi:PAS domain S-box-containing protein